MKRIPLLGHKLRNDFSYSKNGMQSAYYSRKQLIFIVEDETMKMSKLFILLGLMSPLLGNAQSLCSKYQYEKLSIEDLKTRKIQKISKRALIATRIPLLGEVLFEGVFASTTAFIEMIPFLSQEISLEPRAIKFVEDQLIDSEVQLKENMIYRKNWGASGTNGVFGSILGPVLHDMSGGLVGWESSEPEPWVALRASKLAFPATRNIVKSMTSEEGIIEETENKLAEMSNQIKCMNKMIAEKQARIGGSNSINSKAKTSSRGI